MGCFSIAALISLSGMRIRVLELIDKKLARIDVLPLVSQWSK